MAAGEIAFDEPIPDGFINMALTSVLMHEVGARAGCRFRNAATKSGRESGVGWLGCAAERQSGQPLNQVGHTLGLRHNFRGSAYFTMDQLGDTDWLNSTAVCLRPLPLSHPPFLSTLAIRHPPPRSPAHPDLTITSIESPNIPKIGVGETVTPHVSQFFKQLGIDDKVW